MFMTGAMLGRAYRISGDAKYADLLATFLLDGGDVQEANGLFRHARSAPFYWSRGNGFAALGYPEALTYLPADHPARETLLERHRRHLNALMRVQQTLGTFGELVDLPGAWGELTSTSMVGYALARGLRLGWLLSDDAAGYSAGLMACWRALSERIDENGGVVDGCISTGVMPDTRAYLNRTAVNGHDDRTGSLALWFACEMAQQP
jgi:rhamnogalacturonyl hydrolase YesR